MIRGKFRVIKTYTHMHSVVFRLFHTWFCFLAVSMLGKPRRGRPLV